jgi:hypothetical protein
MQTLDIVEALNALKSNIKALGPIMKYYEDQIAEVKSEISLRSKRLDGAIIDQSALMYRYDQLRIEVKKVRELVKLIAEEKYGALWKFYTEKYSRELSPKDKDQYIKHDAKYVAFAQLLCEIDELYDHYDVVVKAFQSRGYALNNLTRLYANNVNDIML